MVPLARQSIVTFQLTSAYISVFQALVIPKHTPSTYRTLHQRISLRANFVQIGFLSIIYKAN